MTIREIIYQCENYEYSNDYLELFKECAQYNVLNQYINSYQFMQENSRVIDKYPQVFKEGYFPENCDIDDYKTESALEKAGQIIAKIILGILKVMAFVITKISSITYKIYNYITKVISKLEHITEKDIDNVEEVSDEITELVMGEDGEDEYNGESSKNTYFDPIEGKYITEENNNVEKIKKITNTVSRTKNKDNNLAMIGSHLCQLFNGIGNVKIKSSDPQMRPLKSLFILDDKNISSANNNLNDLTLQNFSNKENKKLIKVYINIMKAMILDNEAYTAKYTSRSQINTPSKAYSLGYIPLVNDNFNIIDVSSSVILHNGLKEIKIEPDKVLINSNSIASIDVAINNLELNKFVIAPINLTSLKDLSNNINGCKDILDKILKRVKENPGIIKVAESFNNNEIDKFKNDMVKLNKISASTISYITAVGNIAKHVTSNLPMIIKKINDYNANKEH